MPMPVSCTATRSSTSCSLSSSRVTRTIDFAALRELDRVAHQVDQHLPQPAGIALQGRGRQRIDPRGQLEAFGVRLFGEQIDGAFDRLAQIEVEHFEGELPGLDLREVENVVDHGEQTVRARPDRLDELQLLRIQARLEQESGHPDDAVHRRPNLMAHVREELRLDARGLDRRVAGALQLVRHLLALRDVLRRPDDFDELPEIVDTRFTPGMDDARRPVGAHDAVFAVERGRRTCGRGGQAR